MINVESSLVKGVVLILAVVLLLLVFIVSVPEGETVVLESVLSAVSELELLHDQMHVADKIVIMDKKFFFINKFYLSCHRKIYAIM